jgi:hypothetical protein
MYTEEFRVWEHGWTRYYERLRIPLELRHSIDESVLGAGDAAADTHTARCWRSLACSRTFRG